MGKVYCACGWVISDVCASEYWGEYFTSVNEEKLDKDYSELKISDFDRAGTICEWYKCQECNRLAVADNKGRLEWYKLEKERVSE